MITAQPPSQPSHGPSARVTHENVVPGVLVGAVHVEERARDQEHRDERREQRPRRLEADDDGDRADDGGERVRGRGRREADRERLAEADRVLLELGAPVSAAVGRPCRHSASFTTTCLIRVYSSIE